MTYLFRDGTIQPLYVGKKLRHYRQLAGKKMIEMARDLPAHYSIVDRWERNIRPLPPSRVEQVCAYLGITFEQLTEDMPTSDVRIALREPLRQRVIEPRTRPYELMCITHGTRMEVEWTDAHVRLEIRAAMRTCSKCPSVLLIVASDVGYQREPAQAFMPRYSQPSLRSGWRQVSKSA